MSNQETIDALRKASCTVACVSAITKAQAGAIIAAIRDGEVPGICVTSNDGHSAKEWEQMCMQAESKLDVASADSERLARRVKEQADRMATITAERDAALARCGEMDVLLREARPLVCSIAADDHNDYWQHAADVTKGIDAALGQGGKP